MVGTSAKDAHGNQGQGFWMHSTQSTGVDTHMDVQACRQSSLAQVSPYLPTQLKHIVTIVSA